MRKPYIKMSADYVLDFVSRYVERSTREIFDLVVDDYGDGVIIRLIERKLKFLRERGSIRLTNKPRRGTSNFYRRGRS